MDVGTIESRGARNPPTARPFIASWTTMCNQLDLPAITLYRLSRLVVYCAITKHVPSIPQNNPLYIQWLFFNNQKLSFRYPFSYSSLKENCRIFNKILLILQKFVLINYRILIHQFNSILYNNYSFYLFN